MPSRARVVSISAVALWAGCTVVLAVLGMAHADGYQPRDQLWPLPRVADAHGHDRSDETAALEALHLGLSELGDGASYIWHRRDGHLSGVVQPTASFKDAAGRICRHVVLVLSSEARSRRTEGIACRLDNGAWQLGG